MKIQGLVPAITAVFALLMAAYVYGVAYGPLRGTPLDIADGYAKNGMLAISFLGLQTLLSHMKPRANIGSIALDICASLPALVISGYALFQEHQAHAMALEPYQETVLLMLFFASLWDVVGNTLGDMIRLFLTDDVKVTQ